jgi:hypothetical protein
MKTAMGLLKLGVAARAEEALQIYIPLDLDQVWIQKKRVTWTHKLEEVDQGVEVLTGIPINQDQQEALMKTAMGLVKLEAAAPAEEALQILILLDPDQEWNQRKRVTGTLKLEEVYQAVEVLTGHIALLNTVLDPEDQMKAVPGVLKLGVVSLAVVSLAVVALTQRTPPVQGQQEVQMDNRLLNYLNAHNIRFTIQQVLQKVMKIC